MSNFKQAFAELAGEGQQHSTERYPYFAIIRAPGDNMMRGHFLDALRAGLEGIDYWFYADVDHVRFAFQSEADREVLYRTRADSDFGYTVRKMMEGPKLR